MTSKPVALLLADLGVTKTHSRPCVSNDNPFSESHVKTLKLRGDFPEQFGPLAHGIAHCRAFFAWYNTTHCHAGIAFMTPQDVHYQRTGLVLATRQETLNAAFKAHPNRFNGRPTRPQQPPAAVWINPPPTNTTDHPEPSEQHQFVNPLVSNSLRHSAGLRREGVGYHHSDVLV